MDIIKLPYTSYLEINVKDLSEFIQNDLLKEEVPRDSWHDDIGDNIYYKINDSCNINLLLNLLFK